MRWSVASTAVLLVMVAPTAIVPARVHCIAVIAIACAPLGLSFAAALFAVVAGTHGAAFTVTGAAFSLAVAAAGLGRRFRRVVVQCGSNGEDAQGAQDNQNQDQPDLHAFSPLFPHG